MSSCWLLLFVDIVDAPFCPATYFVLLIFVGPWTHLCQGSSLGLEPISFMLFTYFIESLVVWCLIVTRVNFSY